MLKYVAALMLSLTLFATAANSQTRTGLINT